LTRALAIERHLIEIVHGPFERDEHYGRHFSFMIAGEPLFILLKDIPFYRCYLLMKSLLLILLKDHLQLQDLQDLSMAFLII
jgi:hypothetical protein